MENGVEDTEARRSRRLWIVAGSLTLIGLVVAWQFVDDPPPKHLRIATGSEAGGYHRTAQRYAELLAEDGYELELVPSAGSLENLELLASGEVDLGFVQGGVADSADSARGLESLASLYFEPLWVFQRAGLEPTTLAEFAGLRICSGTRALALALLAENGVGEAQAEFTEHSAPAAIEALVAGSLDVAFVVGSLEVEAVRQALGASEIELFELIRAPAYLARHRYLARIELTRGMADLERDLPAEPRTLLAPTATLVAGPELHDGLLPLLLQAAIETHAQGGLFEAPERFPSWRNAALPMLPAARTYLENGPSFLYRILPFGMASAIDRLKILLLPLFTLLFPLFKLAPPLWRWRIRFKIIRWYRELRAVDAKLEAAAKGERAAVAAAERARIEGLRHEVARVSVPLGYMGEYYSLREHVDLVLAELAVIEREEQAG